jgi:hypothetical protein
MIYLQEIIITIVLLIIIKKIKNQNLNQNQSQNLKQKIEITKINVLQNHQNIIIKKIFFMIKIKTQMQI